MCEGYTDVIGFHHAGLPRAVATCGTALADEHMQRLKNFARRIILAYDADAAGQGAAEKFYEWEQKLELDIHVLRLPPGADPGELGAKDPAALSEAVAQARPFLAFRVERILDAADISSRRGPGPRRRAGVGGDRRPPERPGPRSVRDAGGRSHPGLRRSSAGPARRGASGAGGGARPTVGPRSR